MPKLFRTVAALVLGALTSMPAHLSADRSAETPYLMTVKGPISANQVGMALPHEHILVDFGGAEQAGPHRYDRQEVIDLALPYLWEAKKAGCRTFIECTPNYLGRDAALFRELAEVTDLNIITNTGIYGAANDRGVPQYAYEETAERLAQRWIDEWQDGIGDTGIRPGFIKTAFDNGPVSEIDEKLFRAACLTHLATGLTIATHTGGNLAAVSRQLDILREYNVPSDAWIWVHAQNVKSFEELVPAFEAGAWIELDGVRENTLQKHIDFVVQAKEQGYLGQTLVSHDAGWYSVGEPRGGTFRPYTTQFKEFLPKLKKSGFSDEEINQLAVQNPAQALAVRVRKL